MLCLPRDGASCRRDPAKLAQNIRIFGGIFLIALAALFAFAGRVVFAIPLFGLGLSLLGLSGLRGLSGGYNPKKRLPGRDLACVRRWSKWSWIMIPAS
ncbi:hypothetical protein QW131_11155 [Roseibium salinum]|nr:hypothetical protein [Roseibium salinum]